MGKLFSSLLFVGVSDSWVTFRRFTFRKWARNSWYLSQSRLLCLVDVTRCGSLLFVGLLTLWVSPFRGCLLFVCCFRGCLLFVGAILTTTTTTFVGTVVVGSMAANNQQERHNVGRVANVLRNALRDIEERNRQPSTTHQPSTSTSAGRDFRLV